MAQHLRDRPLNALNVKGYTESLYLNADGRR